MSEAKSSDIPIIKTFVHNNKFYCYDLLKNEILLISEKHLREIKVLSSIGINKYTESNCEKKEHDDIISLLNMGFFTAPIITDVLHQYNDRFKYLVDRFMQDLVLQITQNCNFRCRYCLFAENHNIERNHEEVNMDWNTAKKSIDYLYEHSKDADNITIGFYGGDPLLNFDLIKVATEYSKKMFNVKNISFITTINGSLLTDFIIKFFVDNNFSLSISLDGPAELQNKNRKFSFNGNDTFDVVFRNINKIREQYSDYFNKQVMINPVVFDDTDVNIVRKFFIDNDMSEERLFFNRANLNGVDYISSNIIDSTRDALSHTSNNTFDPNEVESYKLFKKTLTQKIIIPAIWQHNGQCVPSVRRLFVTVHGDLYPCEKIVENKAFKLGNIHDKGVELDRVQSLLNVGKVSENECKKCWAIRFCDMCISHCLDPEKNCLSKEAKMVNCEIQKNKLLKYMNKYIDEKEG